MGENESKFNPIKIEEAMKKTFYIVIAIIIIFIIFLLILSIFVIPQLGPQNALIANSVIWSISIVVILIISCFLRSFLKLRSFELTENYILFQLFNFCNKNWNQRRDLKWKNKILFPWHPQTHSLKVPEEKEP